MEKSSTAPTSAQLAKIRSTAGRLGVKCGIPRTAGEASCLINQLETGEDWLGFYQQITRDWGEVRGYEPDEGVTDSQIVRLCILCLDRGIPLQELQQVIPKDRGLTKREGWLLIRWILDGFRGEALRGVFVRAEYQLESMVIAALEGAGLLALKSDVCRGGMPDLQVLHNGRVIFIELKAHGELREEQVRAHQELEERGFPVLRFAASGDCSAEVEGLVQEVLALLNQGTNYCREAPQGV